MSGVRPVAVVAAGLLVIAALLGCAPQKPLVDVWGDSLTASTAPYLVADLPQAQVRVRAYPGTALCDWTTQMVTAIRAERPKVVVLAFHGNSRPCDHLDKGTALAEDYRRDVLPVLAAITAVSATPVCVRGPVGQPQNDFTEATKPSVVGWCDGRPGVADAGAAVAPGRVFTPTLGGVRVRQPDGVHLTPAGSARYGSAIAGFVRTALR